jgi:hypothetical protein
MVDVSLEEVHSGRPVRRCLYDWPVCLTCWEGMKASPLYPAAMAEVENPLWKNGQWDREEFCCRCGAKTKAGCYATWPASAKHRALIHYMHLLRELIEKRWAGENEDAVLDHMDEAWSKMSNEEITLANSLPLLRIGETDG